MFVSPITAADEMRALFAAGWAATSVVNPVPEIRWRGKEVKSAPLPTTYFSRFTIVGAKTGQGGFLDVAGGSAQVFDSFGHVYVQVFAPIDVVDSYRKGELLAIAARDIFQGTQTAGGVWFRNARYVEIDDDGKFYCWNVIVEYEFSET